MSKGLRDYYEMIISSDKISRMLSFVIISFMLVSMIAGVILLFMKPTVVGVFIILASIIGFAWAIKTVRYSKKTPMSEC